MAAVTPWGLSPPVSRTIGVHQGSCSGPLLSRFASEIADVLTRVRLWNRQTGVDEWVPAEALDLAYRYSNLKFTSRAVVLEIELQLHDTDLSIPLRHLGGQRVPLAQARESVLETRRAKGMVVRLRSPMDVRLNAHLFF